MVWTAFRLWHGGGACILGSSRAFDTLPEPSGRGECNAGSSGFCNEIFLYALGDSSVGELCCDRSGSGLLYVSEEQERFSQQYPGTVIRRKNDKRMAGKTCGYSGGFCYRGRYRNVPGAWDDAN